MVTGPLLVALSWATAWAGDDLWRIEAERVVWEDGELTFQEARASACGCVEGPWALSAEEMKVTGAEVETRGLRVEVGAVSLPLPPLRLHLDTRPFRVGLPDVGLEDGAVRGALPLIFEGANQRFTLSPGWWEGPLVSWTLQKTRGKGSNPFVGELGWREGLWGGGLVDLGFQDQRWRGAVEGRWLTEFSYLRERGEDFLARALPFSEQALVLEWGPARLEARSWQLDGGDFQVLPSLIVSEPAQTWGPARFQGLARLDMVEGRVRTEAGGGVDLHIPLGLVEVDAGARARTLGYPEAQATDGQVSGGLWIPAWRDFEGARHELTVGFHTEAGARSGELVALLPWDEGPEAWGWGPAVHSRWWGPSSAWLSAWVPRHAEGWGVDLQGGLRARELDARFQFTERAGTWLAGGSMTWPGRLVQPWLGTSMSSVQPLQAEGGLAFRIPVGEGEWLPSVAALGTLEGLQELQGGLHWRHRSGCLSVGASGGIAADRESPEVHVHLSVLDVLE